MSENVPMIDIGSATVGMMVAGMFRRNMKITITTRASARIRENCTSSTDSRMVVDRSYITLMLTPAGTSTRNVGSSFLTASTTSMVLVPGRLHRKHAVLAIKRACGQIDVGVGDRLLDFVDADAARGERIGVDLHTHCVLLLALHLHLRYPADGGD